ncbi:hypothetical protein ACIGPN_05980 [Streptomyces afghaniensis]|uniref:hypothetical protein n=1 Tax=Streptomyces afghaniensis TaxID=66865 RepID=UPI0037D550C3
MDRIQAAEWLKIWRQAQKPGSAVDWLAWLAANGYRVTQGEPTEPLPSDAVWELVADADLAGAVAGHGYSQAHEPGEEHQYGCPWVVRHGNAETPSEECGADMKPGKDFCPKHQARYDTLTDGEEFPQGD